MNEETEKWLKDMGVQNTTKDYHEILNDPEIQAVLICSSTDTHSPISLEAIAAGKHVFCEKPIDHDLGRIREVLKALEGSSLKYQVGFNRRFDHNFAAVKQAVLDGKVGDPHIIRITSRDPEPPSPAYVAVSGGMFLDMTIHDFDMVRFLAGCDAEEIYVQSAVLVDPGIGEAGDVDTAVITLKMANGAIAVIDNSDARPTATTRERRCSDPREWRRPPTIPLPVWCFPPLRASPARSLCTSSWSAIPSPSRRRSPASSTPSRTIPLPLWARKTV